MTKLLKLSAIENSTYVVSLTFKDQDGSNVMPTSATWTLTDAEGTVINSRENVAISPLAATANIILQGLDLAAGDGSLQRNISITAAYNSLGSIGLPLLGSVDFYIERL